MAITFSDLYTDAGLKALDEFLAGKSYISGEKLTLDDIKVYAAVLEKPADSFANVSKWYDAVSFQLASTFPGKAAGVRVSSGKAGTAAPVPAAAAGGDDDDDLDLFGDETEEDKKAVRCVEMEGLFWDASKLVSVGYGIKKLQIMLTIVDDLVSVDDLIEEQLTVEPRQQAHPHLCLGPALKAQSGFSPPAVPSTCSSPHTTGQPNAVINFTPQPQLILAQLTRLPLRADVSSEAAADYR
ncbi:hypothetical protein ACFX13_043647 [Malus domestica]